MEIYTAILRQIAKERIRKQGRTKVQVVPATLLSELLQTKLLKLKLSWFEVHLIKQVDLYPQKQGGAG